MLRRVLEPCSSETGAYCQARKRLPERFFSTVACLVGRNLDASADSQWLWKGRRVYLFDGSTVSMPDTAENRRYPLTFDREAGEMVMLQHAASTASFASAGRNRAAIRQFQSDAPSAGGLSAGDQPASTSWSRAPEFALSTNVAGHRPAPRRRSSGRTHRRSVEQVGRTCGWSWSSA